MSSAAVPAVSKTSPETVLRSSGNVVRTPFYWESGGESLLAWLHTPNDQPTFNHAVLIAPPIGYKHLHTQRSLRHLADELARRGIPALRFDWHGIGDSAGLDEDPERLTTWQRNLRDAVTLLSGPMKFSGVSLVALRLGALISATAFPVTGVDHLVLWAPVISGKTYLREMTATDRTSEIPAPQSPGTPADLEPAGFTLTEETARDLAGVNLLEIPPMSCPTLLVSRADSISDQKLAAHYQAAGFPLAQRTFTGYAELMADPHKGEVPWDAIRHITDWLTEQIVPTAAPRHAQEHDLAGRQQMTCAARSELAPQTKPVHPIREQVLWLSESPRLFGILSSPAHDDANNLPTVVLLTSGASYHIGPGRLYVHLARRLAAAGFRCVRLDIEGIGDSVTSRPEAENEVYPSTALRDADLALRRLREQGWGEKFVLMGLCSGAYNAFQSAVTLPDVGLAESVLINPLTFFWQDGMVMSDLADRQIAQQEYYFESAWRPGKWLRLISGRSSIGLWGALKILAGKIKHRFSAAETVGPSELPPREPHTHPLRDDLPADLTRAVDLGRHLAMFFAVGDPGYGILQHKARHTAQRLQRSGKLDLEFIPNADHTFTRRPARQDLIERITRHLTERYRPS